jgi:hypothetical protein
MTLATIDDLLSGKCGTVAAGDVLAFNGTSKVDVFIQDASSSQISHVAILIPDGAGAPSVLEATGAGVTVTPLAQSLTKYAEDHICFYLPLAAANRARVDGAKLAAYYATNAKEKYNYAGVVGAGLYDIDNPLFHSLLKHAGVASPLAKIAQDYAGAMSGLWEKVFELNPGYRRLFCSQLVTEALLATGVALAGPPNPRLVVPVEVCHFAIYGDTFQLNGATAMADPFRWAAAPITGPGA